MKEVLNYLGKIDIHAVYTIGLWVFLMGFFALMLHYIFIEKSKKFAVASLVACFFLLIPIFLPTLFQNGQELIDTLRASSLIVGIYGIIATVFNFKIYKGQKGEAELSFFGGLCVVLVIFLSVVEFQRTSIEGKRNRELQGIRDNTMDTLSNVIAGIPSYQLSRVQKDSLFQVLLETLHEVIFYNKSSNDQLGRYARETKGEVRKAGVSIEESKKAIIAFDSAAYGLIDSSFELTNGRVEGSKLYITQRDSTFHAQTRGKITKRIDATDTMLTQGLDKIDSSLVKTNSSLENIDQAIQNLPNLVKKEDIQQIVEDIIVAERELYLEKMEKTMKTYYEEMATANREGRIDKDTTLQGN